MWMTILSFIGGPVIKGLIDAYQAKLKAGNVESKIAADLPAVGLYNQLLKKYSPDLQPSYYGLEGFLQAMVLIEGLKRTGKDPTRERFMPG